MKLSKQFITLLIICSVLILFFIPWMETDGLGIFRTDITSYSGLGISKLGLNLYSIADNTNLASFKFGSLLLIGIIKIPALCVISGLLLVFSKHKIRYVFSFLTLLVNLIYTLTLVVLPFLPIDILKIFSQSFTLSISVYFNILISLFGLGFILIRK